MSFKAESGPRGPYTVWTKNGSEGWSWCDYQTLEDAVLVEKYTTEWVVTKPVDFQISEAVRRA